MRAALLWPATLVVVGCAHGSSATANRPDGRAIAAQSQEVMAAEGAAERANVSPDIIERPHPPHEVSEIDHPPAAEARGPRDLDGAAVVSAAPPPPPTGAPVEVAIEPTDTPSAASVPPSS
jgi:hypothetical protein